MRCKDCDIEINEENLICPSCSECYADIPLAVDIYAGLNGNEWYEFWLECEKIKGNI
jgi:hypothetical protein